MQVRQHLRAGYNVELAVAEWNVENAPNQEVGARAPTHCDPQHLFRLVKTGNAGAISPE